MPPADIGPELQLQIAAIVFPIIALVVSFAIDSIENEGWIYRSVVAGFGFGAIIPAIIVVILAVTGAFLGFTPDSLLGYLLISFGATTVLVTTVLLHEVVKGIREEREVLYVLISIVVSLILLVIIMNQVG